MARTYRPGDLVIYRMRKHTTCPGPRAQDVRPAPKGEDYDYHVEKYWVVAAVEANGYVVAQTRRGKRHRLEPNDPALRRASLWERWRHARSFPDLSQSAPSRQPHGAAF